MNATADTNINIRTTRATRTMIDQAARVVGRNRSEFVLEVAEERAREVLMDRTQFALDQEKHAQFLALLEEPLPSDSAQALKALLARKAPWET